MQDPVVDFPENCFRFRGRQILDTARNHADTAGHATNDDHSLAVGNRRSGRSFSSHGGESDVPNSVIEAIQLGIWDYEPEEAPRKNYDKTGAMPGSSEKLSVLADRVQQGQPLWHPEDRRVYQDDDD